MISMVCIHTLEDTHKETSFSLTVSAREQTNRSTHPTKHMVPFSAIINQSQAE